MSQCTLGQVHADAAAHLADPTRLWTSDALLLAYSQRAYRKMFDTLGSFRANRIEHTIYFNLPPYTSLWVPVSNGVTDMAEPSQMFERGSLTTGVITGTSGAAGSPINVNANGHLLGTNADVIISGVTGTSAPWGRWFVTVVDVNNFTLNGSVSDGLAGTGGTFSFSTEKFIDLNPNDVLTDRDPGPCLMDYTWQNNAIYFRGASQLRQVMLVYLASGTAPSVTSTVIGIDNCLNFLGAATAMYCAASRGWTPLVQELRGQAFGPKGEGDASGGFIRDLVSIQVLEMQRKQRTPQPFRASRNSPTLPWLM